jgi:hypothetical protein
MAEAASFTLTSGGASHVAVYDTTHTQGTGACTGAGCEATATYTLSGNTLTIVLENTSSDTIDNQNVLTGLFFDTTPDLTVTDDSFTGAVATWKGGYNGGAFEIKTSSKNGVNDGLDDDSGTGTIVLTFSNALTSLTIDDSQVHFQAIVGSGDSDKLGEGEGEEGEEGGEGEGEEGGEGQTPEPASLLLLGSALTAAGFRLRRARL